MRGNGPKVKIWLCGKRKGALSELLCFPMSDLLKITVSVVLRSGGCC